MSTLSRLDRAAVWDILKKAMLRPLALALAAVALVFPRDARLWAFGSWHGERFADNAKALFVATARSPDGIQPVWITRSRRVCQEVRAAGYEAHLWNSPRGLWRCLRAGVYVYDCYLKDINYWTSFGAFRVNLWHGVPLKKIERDIDSPGHNYNMGFRGPWWYRLAFWIWGPWVLARAHLMTVTSPQVRHIFARAFDLPESKITVAGFPRNDVLFKIPAGATKGATRLAFYLPTFRDDDAPIPLDWAELDAGLKKIGMRLSIKLHARAKNSLPDLVSYSSIAVVDTATDVYEALAGADVLVTDYSSVFIDYLLTDRPVVFFPYDLEDYRTRMRGMYFDYDAVTPGPRVMTTTELLQALSTCERSQRYLDVKLLFHSVQDGRSSERVLREILARTS